jgi:hypothetical protein
MEWLRAAAWGVSLLAGLLAAHAQAPVSGPPAVAGFFPLNEVHRGLQATAWTVFSGAEPEPMQVEILGVLRGARGPGHDMILAQLHGAKPEYTGVVAGMSGSPVYVGDRLLGALSYRIGQFSRDPIAGITPVEQMLEVRDLPLSAPAGEAKTASAPAAPKTAVEASSQYGQFQAMETPLVMAGFRPEAVKLWQQRLAGTGLETVAAGGSGASDDSGELGTPSSTHALAALKPGSAVSMQLVRGDLEIAATCTVTYVDPKQLLACGHPVLGAGPVSLPMTTAEVVATLASPLNAFKIVNTGPVIGAFNQDRDAAIRGVLGEPARMIPLRLQLHSATGSRQVKLEILDQPALTPQAVLVALYNSLLESNEATSDTSYHLTGSIALDSLPPVPLDEWAPGGEGGGAMAAALEAGGLFSQLYDNAGRTGLVRSVQIEVESIPHRVDVDLLSARLISGDILRPGAQVEVEATVRPWHREPRNVRLSFPLPARLPAGNLRLLVSDAATLDRTLDQPRLSSKPSSLDSALAEARRQHPADRLYVSLLAPEAQASIDGQTLPGLPLSLVNTLEPERAQQQASLNGESAELAAQAEAGGVLSGFVILNLHIDSGGGVN